MSHLFDIACNFSSERFDNDLQDVIQRAIENKVNKFLIVSASLKEVEKVYEIYQQNNKNCFFFNWNSPTSRQRIWILIFQADDRPSK